MKRTRLKNSLALVSAAGTMLIAATSAAAPSMSNVFVSDPVTPVLTPALRDMPPARLDLVKPRDTPARIAHPSLGLGIDAAALLAAPNTPWDPPPIAGNRTPQPSLVFAGIPFTGFHPPDTVGDVGPNHYVQATNTLIEVFDKNGVQVVAAHQMGDLWQSIGGTCAQDGGDPVVLYDQLADRWFMAQLGTTGNNVCIAVSKTPDPGGQYFAYRFTVPQFPDYLKFGVWPDAYYMGSNENAYSSYAFNRAKILLGQAATFQRFTGETNFLLPADLDGATPPPAGAPGLFYTFKDDVTHGGQDRIEVFELHVDWTTPANTTFQMVNSIPISAFNYTICGEFNFTCVPQKNTTQKLDAVSEWPMFHLQYRNFGAYRTLVGNFTIDVDNTNHGGVRWFELRNPGTGWVLQQEGTQAPDANHRFMGSIAMDQSGNIALGYSVSGTAQFPEIRYATRQATDMPGTLQNEVTMKVGGGSQTGIERWGDYSAMTIDPVDDCTFFYTNEYMPAQGQSWATAVGKFRIPGCGKANGLACVNATDCQSGFCSDGVCCASDCGTDTKDCQACSMAAGSTADGTCAPLTAGTTCRAAAGACDAAETCDGMATACPADQFLAATTVCRAATAACDAAEMCTGTSVNCPADAVATVGTVCRVAAGACDRAEACDGMTTACPADQFMDAMTVCRAATDACDAAEKCSGTGIDCPADAVMAAGTVCRAAAGVCDTGESCDGTSAACPMDQFMDATTVCRAATNACDVAEMCSGSAADCPADALAAMGTVCRAAAGACDAEEACDGATDACPADQFLAATTVCRDATGACDVAEMCSGSAADCPADAVAAVGTMCRAAAGPCDAAEACDGTTNACPVDQFLDAKTVCRDATGTCDIAETCSGTKAECPADALSPAGTVCRAATNSCDADEVCDGATNMCPTDASMEDGAKCDNGGMCRAGACQPASKTDPTDNGSCGCRIPGGESNGEGSAFALFAGLAIAVGSRRRTPRLSRHTRG